MSIRTVVTGDGIVVREFHPSSERSYRMRHDGRWDHCPDHKGPWYFVSNDEVPQKIKSAYENFCIQQQAAE